MQHEYTVKFMTSEYVEDLTIAECIMVYLKEHTSASIIMVYNIDHVAVPEPCDDCSEGVDDL